MCFFGRLARSQISERTRLSRWYARPVVSAQHVSPVSICNVTFFCEASDSEGFSNHFYPCGFFIEKNARDSCMLSNSFLEVPRYFLLSKILKPEVNIFPKNRIELWNRIGLRLPRNPGKYDSESKWARYTLRLTEPFLKCICSKARTSCTFMEHLLGLFIRISIICRNIGGELATYSDFCDYSSGCVRIKHSCLAQRWLSCQHS